MNSFNYLSIIIKDELRAAREEFRESKVMIIAFLCVLIALIIYLDPFPNRHIYFATDDRSSDWHSFAEESASILKEKGLDVSVIDTDGAIDNVIRLNDSKEKVNTAFTFGAALNQNQIDGIYSLGSISYEPIWIFYKTNKIHQLKDLKDLTRYTVGLGPSKSGSYMIAKKILMNFGIDVTTNSHFVSGRFLDVHNRFLNGDLDAFIFVSTYQDPIVQGLLRAPNVALYSFSNAISYQKKHSYLQAVNLPAGSIDLLNQIPPKEVSLVATTTSLVVRRDMHPDLQLALLMATKDIIRSSTDLLFAKRNEFPAYVDSLIPISPVAQRFYDYGPPHAARYLPYWIAGFIDRAWLLLLALVTVFYPLSKLNIHLRKFRFAMKERPHYEALLEMDKLLLKRKLSDEEKGVLLNKLDRINQDAIEEGAAVGEEKPYFDLLSSISMLRKKIESN